MSKSSVLMLTNTQGQLNIAGAAVRADGWYGFSDGLHTLAIYVVNFTGRLWIEASLADAPTDNDWFPVTISGNDATPYLQFPLDPLRPTGTNSMGDTATMGLNIIGNYTWLRARVDRSYIAPIPTTQPQIFALGYVDHILINN
jgi:hypothetical protein